MVGLYTTGSSLFSRQDMFVQEYLDEKRISLELCIVAVAWDDNGRHAVMHLDGAQDIAFCPATGVVIANPKLQL